jgi:diguanylate cyclase (GGDEF)-like protein
VLPWAFGAMLAYTMVEVRSFHAVPPVIYDIISAWMLFLLAVAGAWFREHSLRRSWYQQQLLEYQALHDWLTGLPNQRCFESRLRELVDKSTDDGRPLVLLLLDLDGFKPYNDRYGHPAGDEALRRVAAELRRQANAWDAFCARVGGEEFAIVWRGLPLDEVQPLADQLRRSVAALDIPHEAIVRGARLSASGGLAQLDSEVEDADPKRRAAKLERRAEEALHEAKAGGRDRLVSAG